MPRIGKQCRQGLLITPGLGTRSELQRSLREAFRSGLAPKIHVVPRLWTGRDRAERCAGPPAAAEEHERQVTREGDQPAKSRSSAATRSGKSPRRNWTSSRPTCGPWSMQMLGRGAAAFYIKGLKAAIDGPKRRARFPCHRLGRDAVPSVARPRPIGGSRNASTRSTAGSTS